MKKISIFAIVLIGLGFINNSCNNETDKAAWIQFIEEGKECASHKFEFLVKCQSQEDQAWKEYQSCLGRCSLNIAPCSVFSPTTSNYSNCLTTAWAQQSLCISSCFNTYHEKMKVIATCKENWDIEFWKCMNSKHQ